MATKDIQLMRFISPTKEWWGAPFSIKIDSTTWSIATDRFLLVAVKGSGPAPGKGYPEVIEKRIVAPIPDNTRILLTEELRDWAGDCPAKLIPAGDVEPEHQGILIDQLIDRRKLAYLLKSVRCKEIRVWLQEKGLLGFEQDNWRWRAFLSTLAEPPDGDEPKFRTSLELAEMIDEAAT